MIKRFIFITLLISYVAMLGGCVDTKPTPKQDDSFNGTIYQVFVRSFADSNGDGIGDFNGITSKLPYLKKLGVDALWLMPIHPSPSYHGYDVLDYYGVNPEYGTIKDFKNLLSEATKSNIKIFLDMVFNHSSSGHEWFKAARKGDEKYRNYYSFVNYQTPTGKYWHNDTNNKYYGYFSSTMPDLNFFNEDLQEEVFNIASFWANLGVSGFRLDGALHFYGENEYLGKAYDYYDNVLFIDKLKQKMKAINPSFYILSEVWTDYKIYADFNKSSTPLDFELAEILTDTASKSGNADYVKMIINRYNYYETINPNFVSAPFLRNHDQDRLATSIDDFTKLRMAAEMLLTLPGTPIIYYGEEIGMKGYKTYGPNIWDETRRLPFLWGDSGDTSWFRSDINQGVKSVKIQDSDNTSLLATYQRLMRVRSDNIALKYGNNITLYENNSYALQGYYREYTKGSVKQRLLILHNFGLKSIDMITYNGKLIYVTNQDAPTSLTVIAPKTTVIIELKD